MWAPSAREIVALENQIRDMSVQLSSQRQQWLAVTSTSPQPPALPGARQSPTTKLSPAAQQMLAMLKENGPPPTGKFEEVKFLEPVRDYRARHASTMLAFDAVVSAMEQALDKQSEVA